MLSSQREISLKKKKSVEIQNFDVKLEVDWKRLIYLKIEMEVGAVFSCSCQERSPALTDSSTN